MRLAEAVQRICRAPGVELRGTVLAECQRAQAVVGTVRKHVRQLGPSVLPPRVVGAKRQRDLDSAPNSALIPGDHVATGESPPQSD